MLVGELQHALRQGGREQHGQALLRARQAPQDVADVRDEAQVEHAVRLVEDGHLNVPQVEDPLLEEIDDPAGGTDQHVDALLEVPALFLIVRAAEGQAQGQAGVLAQRFGIAVDLHRQLARRRNDNSRAGP